MKLSGTRWNRDEDKILIEMARDGNGADAVAARLGRSRAAVVHRAQVLGARFQHKWQTVEGQAKLKQIGAMMAMPEPMSYKEIAAKLGMTRELLRKTCEYYGLKYTPEARLAIRRRIRAQQTLNSRARKEADRRKVPLGEMLKEYAAARDGSARLLAAQVAARIVWRPTQ